MSTFTIIAIPFFAASLAMLLLAAKHKHLTFLILGGVFMATSAINAIIGLSAG